MKVVLTKFAGAKKQENPYRSQVQSLQTYPAMASSKKALPTLVKAVLQVRMHIFVG